MTALDSDRPATLPDGGNTESAQTATATDTPDTTLTPLRGWLAVLAITLGVFSFTTTEMVPVGLLPSISADLSVSEGMTGLTVSLYGLTAGLLAPVLTAATRRFDRRTLLVVVLVIFVTGNVVSAFATTFSLLMVSRLVTGFAHGLMWSIAASIAVRLVPEDKSVRAISIVFSGISIAFVFGVPIGTFIGELSHWRVVFGAVAALGAVALVSVMMLLPKMAPTSVLNLSELPGLFRISNLRITLVVTAIVVTGHFSAYTYISPFLSQESGIPPQWVSSLLLLYGVASVIGNFVAGAAAAKNVRLTLVVAVGVASLSVLGLLVTGGSPWIVVALMLTWGFVFAAFPLCLQTLVLKNAPNAPEAASSVFICSFNVTIALGAFVGGFLLDASGTRSPMWIGVVLTLAAAVILFAFYDERKDPSASEEETANARGGRHRMGDPDMTMRLYVLGTPGGEGRHRRGSRAVLAPQQVPVTQIIDSTSYAEPSARQPNPVGDPASEQRTEPSPGEPASASAPPEPERDPTSYAHPEPLGPEPRPESAPEVAPIRHTPLKFHRAASASHGVPGSKPSRPEPSAPERDTSRPWDTSGMPRLDESGNPVARSRHVRLAALRGAKEARAANYRRPTEITAEHERVRGEFPPRA